MLVKTNTIFYERFFHPLEPGSAPLKSVQLLPVLVIYLWIPIA